MAWSCKQLFMVIYGIIRRHVDSLSSLGISFFPSLCRAFNPRPVNQQRDQSEPDCKNVGWLYKHWHAFRHWLVWPINGQIKLSVHTLLPYRAVESIHCSLTDMVPCTNDKTFLLSILLQSPVVARLRNVGQFPCCFPGLRVAEEVMSPPATTSVRHIKQMHLYEQCTAHWPTSDTLYMHIPFSFFVELTEMFTCTISICVSVLNPAALSLYLCQFVLWALFSWYNWLSLFCSPILCLIMVPNIWSPRAKPIHFLWHPTQIFTSVS